MTSLALAGPLSTALPRDIGVATPEATACAHCGQPAPTGQRFCCTGCTAAYEMIQGLGLGSYYRRVLDAAAHPPRPDGTDRGDLARHVVTDARGQHSLVLAVDGVQCGACVWLIEAVLAREPEVLRGRVNMTTRRLTLVWQGGIERAEHLVERIEALGYRLVPFNTQALAAARDATDHRLMRALAVAGFAATNVMLISIGIWSGLADSMGPATRALMHWVSALIAMPAIAYAGMPFFTSAVGALRHGRTNMDVPISIGVVLVTTLSLIETLHGGLHAYFDSAISLLFFLLIGRVLDHRARGAARATAEQLLALRNADVAVMEAGGGTRRCHPDNVPQGALVLVGMGERIGVDGTIARGETMLDASLVSGESAPMRGVPGMAVFAGTLNLGGPVSVCATATGAATMLAECARLIEAAEARRGRIVALADRVARRYAPTVHVAALATFLGWYFGAGLGLGASLLIACAVLIITCPCALALAVPVVQVITTGELFRAGILVKSATALERLAEVDTVVFDKTGTLTEPTLGLADADRIDPVALRLAAGLAARSRHPLARALAASAGTAVAAEDVREHPGEGMSRITAAGEIRLGSRRFCGVTDAGDADAPELWLVHPDAPPQRFAFQEAPRADAAAVVRELLAMGLDVRLLSGDHDRAVARVADALGIAERRGGCSPVEKVAAVEALARAGRKVLMVGDGLNDGPALAAAHVSLAPSSAADISQTAADVVFQGKLLAPVPACLLMARRGKAAMRENLALSIGYNMLMVPLAMAGYVTPWLAAVAMSSSSLLVMGNSLRLRWHRPGRQAA